MVVHLMYDYLKAHMCGEYRHAEEVIKDLGITWQHSTPQSISGQILFWNSENAPEELPPYITKGNWDPIEWIGQGLSMELAQMISSHLTFPQVSKDGEEIFGRLRPE